MNLMCKITNHDCHTILRTVMIAVSRRLQFNVSLVITSPHNLPAPGRFGGKAAKVSNSTKKMTDNLMR